MEAITIMQNNGQSVTIPAVIIGQYAAHKRHNRDGWQVTHIATGHGVAQEYGRFLTTESKAIAFASVMADKLDMSMVKTPADVRLIDRRKARIAAYLAHRAAMKA